MTPPEPTTVSSHLAHSAIIDIGSNSVRLVVYGGPQRVPSVLFNEKVLAGLGRSLAETGTIDTGAMTAAGAAIRRFAWLAREMNARTVRTVATAAVRDAANGHELLALARDAGLDVEVLSGQEEAQAAGYGVVSAIPDADGIVGDLGGGSLELVRVTNGTIGARVSFPLGVLRLGAIRARGAGALAKTVSKMVADAGWTGQGAGLPFYLVGGSWRALARLDMHLRAYPLPIVHGYPLSPDRIAELEAIVGERSRGELKSVPNLSGGRVPTLADAAALLRCVLSELNCDDTVVSASGLREGLLYAALPPAVRSQDPLIVAAHDEGARQGRFAEHGDLLRDWIAPLFDDEGDAAAARLRHMACLLADVGWHANPDFRAERGLEIALHGNWVAIDAPGRAIVAQALYTCLGGGNDVPAPLGALADPAALRSARHWGLAMRLGQRLSGGLAAPLRRSAIRRNGDRLDLCFPKVDALYGEAVSKRHKALAQALALEPATVTT